MKNKIKKTLAEIRPYLQRDGGDVELVDFDSVTGVLKIRLKGACVGCPMAHITVQEGIGRYLKKQIPAIKKIEAV